MIQQVVEKFYCSVCEEEIVNECFIVSGAFVTNSSAGNELKFVDEVKLAHKECVGDENAALADCNDCESLTNELKDVTQTSEDLADELATANAVNETLADTNVLLDARVVELEEEVSQLLKTNTVDDIEAYDEVVDLEQIAEEAKEIDVVAEEKVEVTDNA